MTWEGEWLSVSDAVLKHATFIPVTEEEMSPPADCPGCNGTGKNVYVESAPHVYRWEPYDPARTYSAARGESVGRCTVCWDGYTPASSPLSRPPKEP